MKLFNNRATWLELVQSNPHSTGLRATSVLAEQEFFIKKIISQLSTMEAIKPGSTAEASEVLLTCLSKIINAIQPTESLTEGPSLNRRP